MSDERPPGTEQDAAALAAVMVRYVLPAAGSLRLEVTMDEDGTWLHLTYTAKESWQQTPPTAHDGLTLVNSAAIRWGHFGDSHWHTLWALLPQQPRTGEASGPDLPSPAEGER
jgi:hypothetical protein